MHSEPEIKYVKNKSDVQKWETFKQDIQTDFPHNEILNQQIDTAKTIDAWVQELTQLVDKKN